MSTTLLVVQTLNGLQLGVLLFLIAAGLTLVFGVMDFINLAHGVQYMLGAYLAVTFYRAHRKLPGRARPGARRRARSSGCCSNSLVFRHLYGRDHLDHVIATFGIILFLNHGREARLGRGAAQPADAGRCSRARCGSPTGCSIRCGGSSSSASGLAVAALLYVLVTHTRIGMLVRAGATNAAMVSALGVDIRRLFMIVFGFGAMLAGFAGIMIAPILSVEPGMGDTILILAFVVIVIGGIGSIRGAFLAALLIGLVDTLGRSFSVDILRLVMAPSPARTVGPGDRLDADLSADGGRALCPAVRAVPGEGPLRCRRRVARNVVAAPRAARRPASVLPIGIFLVLALRAAGGAVGGRRATCSASASRVMIFAIAAVALDLLVGYGALISFGHAAFIGLGAYAVGILAAHGIGDALIALPAALAVSALFAFLTGIVCLRTKGVYFIMITLAFGQMAFFTASSLAPYGGDDGLTHRGAQHVRRASRSSRTNARSTTSCSPACSAPIFSAARSSPRASAACCAARRRTRSAWRRSDSTSTASSSSPM